MAVNISEILQKFQLRGAFSAGTQIIGKATGTNADPASYPISLFLRALFDMLSFDSDNKTITYIDKDGNAQQLYLGLSWSDFTTNEKQDIIDTIIDGSVEDVLTQLNTYVQAERLRVSAEATRSSAETTRVSNETARVSNETTRESAEKTRKSAEKTRVSNETTRQTQEETRQTQETTRQSNETQRISDETTRQSQESTRQSNETQRIVNENLRQTNTSLAIQNAETATANAQETAEHPSYFDEDLFQYIWDSATKQYTKTDVNAGTILRVDYIYSSVAELEAETRSIPDGKIAVVNTENVEDADNGRFYIRFKGNWKFLVDLSGIQGAQGFTPQMLVGNVTQGVNMSDYSVSVRRNGADSLGNPKYYIDIKLPTLVYSDFTEEQITELQRPANAMISVLEATDALVKQNEQNRVTEESNRVSAETKRVQAEEHRVREVDDLVKRLNDFQIVGFERRIYNLEVTALAIGETVGEDDEIGYEVWS